MDRMMMFWIVAFLAFQVVKAEVSVPTVIYAQVGGTVILPRVTKLVETNLYVNWKSQTTKLEISRNPQSNNNEKINKEHASRTSNFSLQLSPVKESDFGKWVCEMHILNTKYKEEYILHRVTVPSDSAVMVGNSVTLKCDVETSSVSAVTVKWIPPVNSHCSDLNLNADAGKLEIKSVSRCHSGEWTCEVKYSQRKAEAKTTVSVIDLSPNPQDPIYVSESSSLVTIPCSLTSKTPWSVLLEHGLQGGSWSFTPFTDQPYQKAVTLLSLALGPAVSWNVSTGADADVQGKLLKDQDLSMERAPSLKIRGTYTCSLTFTSKTLSSLVKVEVLHVSSSSNRVQEGVNLTCSLGRPLPADVQLKWKCPSCSSSEAKPTGVKTIDRPTVHDNGKWTCELWKNEEMLTSAYLQINIGKPPVNVGLWWTVGIGCGSAVIVLLVVIIVMVIRRRKQMMMYRRHKIKFCCCENSQQKKGFYKT